MEALIFITLVIIFIILLNVQSALRSNAFDNKKDLKFLAKQLEDIKNQLANWQPNTIVENLIENEKRAAEQKVQEAKEALRHQSETVLKAAQEKQRIQYEEKQLRDRVSSMPVSPTIDEPLIYPQPTEALVKQTVLEKWSKNNPDIEKFIGENLISKIGIAILVLAIGFFVKYAIDNDWIKPIGRVAIGVLCGGILIGLAHKMLNSYRSFSSVLAGGGLAVLYFTITLAFRQFQLFDQTTAFIIMIVITTFAVVLSLLYNKQELAIIALIGGFVAPFLVSTGSGNYKVLFAYLIILNTGLLIIAYHKAWRLLNILSFIFTIILFGSWLLTLNYEIPIATYTNGFMFATIFYLLFFVINIAHNIKEKMKFIASDFGILLANTALYFAVGIYCLSKVNAQEYRGLFSAAMAAVNLSASYLLFRKQKVDNNILYLLIGITLTFVSITAPIQLHGNYITLFWASEAVLLYWLFLKSQILIVRYSSLLVWILMLISLFIDWTKLYLWNNAAITILANKGFVTSIFAGATTYTLFLLHHRQDRTKKKGFAIDKNVYRIVAIILLFIVGALEINYQFNFYYPDAGINLLYLLLYLLGFISLLTFITQKIKNLQLNWKIIAVMFAIGIVFYFLFIPATLNVHEIMLQTQNNSKHFAAHWATALVVVLLMYRLIQLLRNNSANIKKEFVFYTWVFCAATVIFFSIELYLLSTSAFYTKSNPFENIQHIYITAVLPILWGVCSFVFMWLGMHFMCRSLRIISLALFTLTLLKLFIFDIRNIPVGGKIAAFFCLGVLLLVVSFMYQRLKKIIIDDKKNLG